MHLSWNYIKSGHRGPACVILLQSFFSVFSIMRAGGLSTRSVLTPVLFLLCAFFFRHVRALTGGEGTQNALGKRSRAGAFLMAVLFTLFCLAADAPVLTEGLDSRLFQLIILAACALGLFFLFACTLLFLLYHAAPFTLNQEQSPCRRLPLYCFVLCLLCWLPYFLYEFPGIMTPDSVNQLEQVLAMAPYSNHHPWTHTMLLGLFYHIGRLFTPDVTIALSFFTVFQMCFMAAAAAWLVSTLVRLGVKNLLCVIVTGFYALIPYHAVFAVTVWKDVLFSGSVALFTTALARLLLPACRMNRREKTVTLVIYGLSGIMMCLFRSNGFYAFLLTFPFLLYVFRRSLKVMLPLQLGVLVIVLCVKGPVMKVFHVVQPDFVESVCIPLQQVSRVICEDRELTQKEWELVHQVMDTTYIKELYAPGFADNMKELVRAGHPEFLEAHRGEYLKLWLSLGLRYPCDYIRAYIDQTKGYWYPDTAYTVADIDGVVPNRTGAASRPLIGGPAVVKAKEILLKLEGILPLYGLVFSMGAMFWALLLCMTLSAVRKQRRRYILFLPGLAVILTLFIATPVSNEFRYAYSLAFSLPLYLLLPFLPSDAVGP